MKGIVLAGGKGSRLYPLTLATSKQLLPIYDKPLIYYPVSLLLSIGIREILLISTPQDLPRFQALFGDGSHLGITLSYASQEAPRGIAEALIIGESFLEGDSVALVLGDNLFYGYGLEEMLYPCTQLRSGGVIFGYEVQDPERYGVVSFTDQLDPLEIIEKPKKYISSYAVPGLYFYDHQAPSMARSLKPSPRGELEITDVSRLYLEQKQLSLKLFDRGFAWLDAGTHDSLQKASAFVQAIQERQGIKIACIEEIAYRKGYIDQEQLCAIIAKYLPGEYGAYLEKIIQRDAVAATSS